MVYLERPFGELFDVSNTESVVVGVSLDRKSFTVLLMNEMQGC